MKDLFWGIVIILITISIWVGIGVLTNLDNYDDTKDNCVLTTRTIAAVEPDLQTRFYSERHGIFHLFISGECQIQIENGNWVPVESWIDVNQPSLDTE